MKTENKLFSKLSDILVNSFELIQVIKEEYGTYKKFRNDRKKNKKNHKLNEQSEKRKFFNFRYW